MWLRIRELEKELSKQEIISDLQNKLKLKDSDNKFLKVQYTKSNNNLQQKELKLHRLEEIVHEIKEEKIQLNLELYELRKIKVEWNEEGNYENIKTELENKTMALDLTNKIKQSIESENSFMRKQIERISKAQNQQEQEIKLYLNTIEKLKLEIREIKKIHKILELRNKELQGSNQKHLKKISELKLEKENLNIQIEKQDLENTILQNEITNKLPVMKLKEEIELYKNEIQKIQIELGEKQMVEFTEQLQEQILSPEEQIKRLKTALMQVKEALKLRNQEIVNVIANSNLKEDQLQKQKKEIIEKDFKIETQEFYISHFKERLSRQDNLDIKKIDIKMQKFETFRLKYDILTTDIYTELFSVYKKLDQISKERKLVQESLQSKFGNIQNLPLFINMQQKIENLEEKLKQKDNSNALYRFKDLASKEQFEFMKNKKEIFDKKLLERDDDIAYLNGTISEQKYKIQSINESIKNQSKRIKDLEGQIKEKEYTIEKQLIQNNEQNITINDLKFQSKRLEERNTEMSHRQDQVQLENESLNKQVNDLQTALIDSAQSFIKKSQGEKQVRLLKKENQNLKLKVIKLEEKNLDLQNQIFESQQVYQTDIKAKEQLIDILRSKKNIAQQDIQNFNKSKEQEKEILVLKEDINAKNNLIIQRNQEIRDLQFRLKEELGDQYNPLLGSGFPSIRQSYLLQRDSDGDHFACDTQIKKLNDQLQQMKMKDNFKNKYQEAQRDLNLLQSKHQKLKKEIEEKNQEFTQMKQQNNQDTLQLSILKKENELFTNKNFRDSILFNSALNDQDNIQILLQQKDKYYKQLLNQNELKYQKELKNALKKDNLNTPEEIQNSEDQIKQNESLKNLQIQFDNLKEQYNLMINKEKVFSEKYNNLKEENKKFVNQFEKQKEIIKQKEDFINQQYISKAQLENQIKNLKKDINRLQMELNGYKAIVGKKEDQHEEDLLFSEIHRDQIENKDKEMVLLKQKIDQLQKQCEDYALEVGELQGKIKMLQTEQSYDVNQDTYNKQIDLQNKKLEEANKQLKKFSNVQNDNLALRNAIEQIVGEKEQVQEMQDNLFIELEKEYQDSMNKLVQKYKQLVQRQDSYTEKLEKYKSDNLNKEVVIQNLKRDLKDILKTKERIEELYDREIQKQIMLRNSNEDSQ